LKDLGWTLDDAGDVPGLDNNIVEGDKTRHIKNPQVVGKANKLLSEYVAKKAKESDFVIVIGGDHSTSIGSITGQMSRDPNLGVLWVDAHARINTPETSPTGNIHGMPISFLGRLGSSATLPGFEWLSDAPKLDVSTQLVSIALRDLDEVEKVLLKKHNVKTFSMSDVDRLGIGKVLELALQHLGNRPIHVSFNINALDPSEAPATATPAPGGLSIREARFILEAAAETGKFRSLDITEVNPRVVSDPQADLTIHNAIYLARSALGYTFV